MPLPITLINPALMLQAERGSETSSETRNPVEYSKTSIALSRLAMGVAILGGLSNVSISPWLKALGRLRPLRGKSMTAKGLFFTCCSLRRKLKNDFNTEMRLALVR